MNGAIEMSELFVKVPADLWSAIQNDLIPMARRVMESRGGFDAFPEAYAVMNQIRDFSEFSSPEIDDQIFGFESSNVSESKSSDSDTKKPEEPSFVSNLNPMVRDYYDNLPENVRNEFNQAVETRMEELGEKPNLPYTEMANVLNEAISAMEEPEFSTDALFEENSVVEEAKPEMTVNMATAIIYDMFQKIKEKGGKKITYRSSVIRLSAAPDNGANPGMIYIKDNNGDYVGKMNRRGYKLPFQKSSNLTIPELNAALIEIATDPEGVAVRYARQTGICACCGAELTDPESVKRGIGPICAETWGF